MELKSSRGGPNGTRSTQNGHEETSMGSQAGAEVTKMQLKSSQVCPQGPRSDFGPILGPKGHPKQRKFESLSVSKLGRDFGVIWGSILKRAV